MGKDKKKVTKHQTFRHFFYFLSISGLLRFCYEAGHKAIRYRRTYPYFCQQIVGVLVDRLDIDAVVVQCGTVMPTDIEHQ